MDYCKKCKNFGCNAAGTERTTTNCEDYMSHLPTNGDRIRAMTDEELAMLLGAPTIVSPPWCCIHPVCPYIDQDPARCDLCALDWLKREGEGV